MMRNNIILERSVSMCLIAFQYQPKSNHPFIFVENRDEAYDRPSQVIHKWKDAPSLLAGRDEVAGGAWLGITKEGRFAALINHPFSSFETIDDPLSRGALVRDFLTSDISISDFTTYLQENRHDYNSYHLTYGKLNDLYLYSNAWDELTHYGPGLHTLSNTRDDLSFHKMERSEKLIGDYLQEEENPSLDKLIEIFQDTVPANEVEDYPQEVPFADAKLNSAMFIKGEEFGTVNTTAIIVDSKGRVKMKEVLYDQEGAVQSTEEEMQLDFSFNEE